MSVEIDPKEVLSYLNELGYVNISAQQLKEFIHDLKKLIKYESRKRTATNGENSATSEDKTEYYEPVVGKTNEKRSKKNNLNKNDYNESSSLGKTQYREPIIGNINQNRNGIAEVGGFTRFVHQHKRGTVKKNEAESEAKVGEFTDLHMRNESSKNKSSHIASKNNKNKHDLQCNKDNNKGTVITVDIKKPKRICSGVSHRHCVHIEDNSIPTKNQESIKKTKECQFCCTVNNFCSCKKQLPVDVENNGFCCIVNNGCGNCHDKALNQVDLGDTNVITKSKSAKKQKSCIKSEKKKQKKSDPVTLYHQYQAEWKKMKFPGEDNRSDLRWAIREKLLGNRRC